MNLKKKDMPELKNGLYRYLNYKTLFIIKNNYINILNLNIININKDYY